MFILEYTVHPWARRSFDEGSVCGGVRFGKGSASLASCSRLYEVRSTRNLQKGLLTLYLPALLFLFTNAYIANLTMR